MAQLLRLHKPFTAAQARQTIVSLAAIALLLALLHEELIARGGAYAAMARQQLPPQRIVAGAA